MPPMPAGVQSFLDAAHSLSLMSKLGVLAAVLLFFVVVHALRVFFKARLSPSKVSGTIKLALLGLALLVAEAQLRTAPTVGGPVANLQSLLVMVCLANLVAYLVVDVYCWYRMDRQVPSFVRDLLTLLVYVGFAVASLRIIFRLDVSSIVTTTTVLTAAVAFAMQATLANVVSGFSVGSDDNLRRGTWITVKDHDITGEIVNVGFRYVTLRTLDNTRVMVPNNTIMQQTVVSFGGRGDAEKTAAHLKVGLGYDLPPHRAIAIIAQVLEQEEHIVKSPPPAVMVSALLDSSVEYELKYFLDHFASQPTTRASILRKLWYAVTREGYSFPFPTREVIQRSATTPFVRERADLAAVLARTELLRGLPDVDVQRLAERVQARVFAAGEAVVRQGDAGSSLFLVESGRLEVLVDGARVGALGDGDVFGEMSLLGGEARKATVVAVAEAHLVEVAKEHLEPVIRANPKLLEQLGAILAQREEANLAHRRRAEQAQVGGGRKEAFMRRLRTFFNVES